VLLRGQVIVEHGRLAATRPSGQAVRAQPHQIRAGMPLA
jgi:hypothetical protein